MNMSPRQLRQLNARHVDPFEVKMLLQLGVPSSDSVKRFGKSVIDPQWQLCTPCQLQLGFHD
jgi:hypothetical protein